MVLKTGGDPQGISTQTLRMSWASRRYEVSDHDLIVVRDGLGLSSVAATQRYLPVAREKVESFMRQIDWTQRNPRTIGLRKDG